MKSAIPSCRHRARCGDRQLRALHEDDPDLMAVWAMGDMVSERMEAVMSAFTARLLREQQRRNMETTQQWLELFTSTILTQQQQQQADLLRVADQLHQFPIVLGSNLQSALVQGCQQLGVLELPHQHQPNSQTSASPLPAIAQGADTSSPRSSAGAGLSDNHAAARPPCNLNYRLPNEVPIGPVYDHHCSCGLIHKAQRVQRMSVPVGGAGGVVTQQVCFLPMSDAIAGC